eukprot:5513891-Prymnesium_polylepis.1
MLCATRAGARWGTSRAHLEAWLHRLVPPPRIDGHRVVLAQLLAHLPDSSAQGVRPVDRCADVRESRARLDERAVSARVAWRAWMVERKPELYQARAFPPGHLTASTVASGLWMSVS